MSFDSILLAMGLTKGSTIGGFFGALVSLRFLDGINLWQGGFALFCGTLAAAYVTPLVIAVVSVAPKTEGAIAFLIGTFGLSLGAAIVKAIPDFIRDIRRRISGATNSEEK